MESMSDPVQNLFYLEFYNTAKTIHCIKGDQGQDLTDERLIRHQITSFYKKNIYTSSEPTLSGQEQDDIYQTTVNKNLSNKEKASLELDITEEE